MSFIARHLVQEGFFFHAPKFPSVLPPCPFWYPGSTLASGVLDILAQEIMLFKLGLMDKTEHKNEPKH